MTADPALAGAALLVLANKQDVRGCEACRLIYEVVTLIFPLQVHECCRYKSRVGLDEHEGQAMAHCSLLGIDRQRLTRRTRLADVTLIG